MNIIEKLLPVQCYAPKSRNFVPRTLAVDGIVQHYFSGKYAFPGDQYNLEKCWQLMRDMNFESEDRETSIYDGKKVYASAHFMIGREGEIWQLVPLDFQAYHAGKSEWHGRQHCNRFMAGIENIGGYKVPYTDAQYDSNAWLCAKLMHEYHFELDMIAGHEDVSPGRKTDPGPTWSWNRLREAVLIKLKREK